MKEKLVYKMKYPHSDFQNQITDDSEKPQTSSYFGIQANEHYVIIPERDLKSDDFINEAISISKLYRMNIRIVRYYEKIRVHLAFDFSNGLKSISRLFDMADRISIIKDESDRDVAAILDFYTHVVIKNGISIAP